MRRLALLALATTALADPAMAQQPWEDAATIEQAIARAIDDSMPSVQYEWSLDWSAFGVKGGRDIFWHLYPPKPYRRWPLTEGVHQRTGWLNVDGRSGSVSVCGDEDIVSRLEFDVSDIWLGKSDVIAELAGREVSATLTSEIARRPLLEDVFGEAYNAEGGDYYDALISRYPASRTWRLEKNGKEPVDLTASYRCTPPGTRHATHCSMTWSVLYRPDERTEGVDGCLPPRRPSDD